MNTQRDPVCGMRLDEAEATGHVDHNGQTYYFCSRNCQEEFEENPNRYVKAEARP